MWKELFLSGTRTLTEGGKEKKGSFFNSQLVVDWFDAGSNHVEEEEEAADKDFRDLQ